MACVCSTGLLWYLGDFTLDTFLCHSIISLMWHNWLVSVEILRPLLRCLLVIASEEGVSYIMLLQVACESYNPTLPFFSNTCQMSLFSCLELFLADFCFFNLLILKAKGIKES